VQESREEERTECRVFKMTWKVDNMFSEVEELNNSVLKVSNHLKYEVDNS